MRWLAVTIPMLIGLAAAGPWDAGQGNAVTPRRPKDNKELRYWLDNMIAYHDFSVEEAGVAMGMSADDVRLAMATVGVSTWNRNPRRRTDPLTVLPYPGGRHPRIGFQDGAIDPQRETKISVFTPWDPKSYVVVDVPEAIFCAEGILYLAHTHVPTLWTTKNIRLEPKEWKRGGAGVLEIERTLPNGAAFGAKVVPKSGWVEMELWLRNGTKAKLTGLRVQNCAMLKGAEGFAQQTNDNKLFRAPYAAVHSADGTRWIIMAWERCGKAWGNAPVPCLHSDPVFPDCQPGETVRLHGRVWFYEGTDIERAFRSYSPATSG